MDPEIEEAFERFCMESDARRKKWETVRLSCEHITRPAGMFQSGRNQERFGWFSFNFSTSTSWLQCHWIYGWDYCLVETQYNLQVRQAIKLSVAIGLAFGLWGLFYACSGLSNTPKKSLQWDFKMSRRVASSSVRVVCLQTNCSANVGDTSVCVLLLKALPFTVTEQRE